MHPGMGAKETSSARTLPTKSESSSRNLLKGEEKLFREDGPRRKKPGLNLFPKRPAIGLKEGRKIRVLSKMATARPRDRPSKSDRKGKTKGKVFFGGRSTQIRNQRRGISHQRD